MWRRPVSAGEAHFHWSARVTSDRRGSLQRNLLNICSCEHSARHSARQRNLLNICDRRQLEEKDRNAGADGKLPEVAPALDQRQPQSAARSLILGRGRAFCRRRVKDSRLSRTGSKLASHHSFISKVFFIGPVLLPIC